MRSGEHEPGHERSGVDGCVSPAATIAPPVTTAGGRWLDRRDVGIWRGTRAVAGRHAIGIDRHRVGGGILMANDIRAEAGRLEVVHAVGRPLDHESRLVVRTVGPRRIHATGRCHAGRKGRGCRRRRHPGRPNPGNRRSRLVQRPDGVRGVRPIEIVRHTLNGESRPERNRPRTAGRESQRCGNGSGTTVGTGPLDRFICTPRLAVVHCNT